MFWVGWILVSGIFSWCWGFWWSFCVLVGCWEFCYGGISIWLIDDMIEIKVVGVLSVEFFLLKVFNDVGEEGMEKVEVGIWIESRLVWRWSEGRKFKFCLLLVFVLCCLGVCWVCWVWWMVLGVVSGVGCMFGWGNFFVYWCLSGWVFLIGCGKGGCIFFVVVKGWLIVLECFV